MNVFQRFADLDNSGRFRIAGPRPEVKESYAKEGKKKTKAKQPSELCQREWNSCDNQ